MCWTRASTGTDLWACGWTPQVAHAPGQLGALLQRLLATDGAAPRVAASRLSAHRVVKEEISDDNAKLPCFNGRVVSWVSLQGLDTCARGPAGVAWKPRP